MRGRGEAQKPQRGRYGAEATIAAAATGSELGNGSRGHLASRGPFPSPQDSLPRQRRPGRDSLSHLRVLRPRRQARFCVFCDAVGSARAEQISRTEGFCEIGEIGSTGVRSCSTSSGHQDCLLTRLQIIHGSHTSLAIRSTRRRQ